MFSSSKCMWLGSSILAGLILTCSLPAMATARNQTEHSLYSAKSLQVASASVSTGTVSEVVHKRFNWVSNPVIVSQETDDVLLNRLTPVQNKTVVAVSSASQSKVTVDSMKSTPKPVQVATTTKRQVVSRSHSSDLTEHALSLVGIPYVFGGTNRSGFDCSGYTQYVFKGSGTYLPRTASEQFKVGSSVKQDQLQPGDLVFFTTYASGASHVGIYIGGGRFVHASKSGVRVTSLQDSYYTKRYLGARRVR